MMKNENNKHGAKVINWRMVAVYALAVVLVGVIITLIVLGIQGGSTEPLETLPSNLNVQVQPVQKETKDLGHDLELVSVGKFAGMFLEDGSNEIVSNIMMVQLVNNGQKDLQLARLHLDYGKFTAEFEATNIPAGQSVILLEKNRRAYVNEKYLSASVDNVVFFQKNMTKESDIFKISGLEGALNITNISDTDISNDIYVYYKYAAGDQLYGGITFRAKVQGGMKAGELRQVMTSHYDPDSCVILAVEHGAQNG